MNEIERPRLVQELLTPEAVRERCDEIFAVAELGGLLYFDYCPEKLDPAVELVLEEIYQNYPNAPVPFHSRWRHFELDGRNMWAELFDRFANISSGERARRRIDLIVVSVLLDAGAGPSWQYKDIETGLIFGRSEGLALASLRLIQSGILSIYGDEDPVRVDAERLINITSLELRSVFQVSNKNDLIGLEERTGLLNQLGKVMKQPESIFRQNNEIRPGNLYDHMTASNNNGEIKARDILIVLLKELGTIWPDGGKIGSLPIGDVGEHPH